MLEPTGPLPPEIYWRRRLVAIAGVVLAFALVIWLILTLIRSTGDPPHARADATAVTTSKAPTSTSPAVATTSETAAKATTTTPAGAVSAVAPCPDQSLAVKMSVGQSTYRAGEQPVFGIVITNISTATCQRDMGSGLQQVSVQSLDGQRRLWSNVDCDQGGPADVRILAGGQQAAYTLTWSGTTSQSNCSGDRVQVPAGSYAVVAQVGAVRSSPEPFNIT